MVRTRSTLLAALGCWTLSCGAPIPYEDTAETVRTLEQPTEADAIRFLEQSSFGPTAGSIGHLMRVGIDAAITEQFAAHRTVYSGTSTHSLGAQFFEHAVERPDQLRQRVAFALSQIVVVSQAAFNNLDDRGQAAMARYLNLLSRDATLDYRTVLKDLSVDPAMGSYLNMADNRAFKPDGTPLDPNENYARELLQLFSLGLYLLNDDGSLKLDGDHRPRPSYSQEQVEALAHTLTGWTYAAPSGCPARGRANPKGDWVSPMLGCDVNHDSSSQRLLLGFRTTAGASAMQHLDQALDNIMAHPNVAPFISKQLIQHLVSSNPSPGYVRRITTVFRNDGSGQVGNLSAVVRAILEDPEARGDQPPLRVSESFGHLRSPALLITNVLRRLEADVSDGSALDTMAAAMHQDVPAPPSVFSYYPPGQPLPDSTTLFGPEFAIMDSATGFARSDFLTRALFRSINGATLHLEVLPATPDAIVAWLNQELLHGKLSPEAQTLIREALIDRRVPASQQRALGFYLAAVSPEFQIER
ncbi:MAG: DUF1800 family protein [Myxococcota bacterium]